MDGLQALRPLVGRWRTSGTILDEQGGVAGEISGSDVYTALPGGRWIAHEVDVSMGGEQTQLLELIGGRDEATGGWRMYAFGEGDEPEPTALTVHEPGLLLLQGTGVRSWLRPEAGPGLMTTRWERETDDGAWQPWLDMRFDRDQP